MKTVKVRQGLEAIRNEMLDLTAKHRLPFSLSDLGGACGICSYLAFRMLKDMGYRPTFHMNEDHCFVTVEGYWVDLTLTQFAPDADEVFFYQYPYRRDRRGAGFVHRSEKKAKTERGIRRLFADWPKDQNPFKQKRIPKLPKVSA